MPLIDNFLLDNYGLSGLKGIQRKTGTMNVGTGQLNFQRFDVATGNESGSRYAEVSNADIGFDPKIIIIRYPASTNSFRLESPIQTVYMSYIKDRYGRSLIGGNADSTGNGYSFAILGNAYVSSTGFRLPVAVNGSNVSYAMAWEAIGWDE